MRKSLATILFSIMLPLAATSEAEIVARNTQLDVTGDGIADIVVKQCTDCGSAPNRLEHLNSSFRDSIYYGNYAATDCDDIAGKSFASSGPFLPSVNEVLLIKGTNGGSLTFGKMKFNGTSTTAGMDLTYTQLGSCLTDPPPVASFTSSSLDLVASFTDTSTNTPTSWSWTFDDGGTSTSKNAGHTYLNAGTYNVCLTATNLGGSSAPSCSDVTVAEVTSTLVAPGSQIDFDSDGTNDLSVANNAACNSDDPKSSILLNGATRGSISKDYSSVTLADAQGASYSTSGPVCDSDEDDSFVLLFKTSNNALIKAWVPANDSRGIRYQFDVLDGGLPPPPVSSFTYLSLDLIVDFTDTSTGSASSWSWDFGDSTGTSTSQNPNYIYWNPGTYNVCLTASNIGGADATPDCQNVTVSQVTSTLVASSGTIDFDSNGTDDFRVQTDGACGAIPNSDTNINGATRASISKSYSSVTLTDAQNATYGNSTACLTPNDDTTVLLVKTGNDAFVKAWMPANDSRGIRYQFEVLAVGLPDPPTANFSFTSLDLVVDFTDASTSDPAATSWSWDFGDAAPTATGMSTFQNPTYVYYDPGTYNVCLTATNISGNSDPTCKDVTVSEVTSTLVAPAGVIDFDADGTNDFQVQADGACVGVSNSSTNINGALRSTVGAINYSAVTLDDAQAAFYTTTTRCDPASDYTDTIFIRTAADNLVKAWAPANDVRGIRYQFEVLGTTCTADDIDLNLSGLAITMVDLRQACNKIIAGSVVVMNGGDLTLQAGETVELTNGFTVDPGGLLEILLLTPEIP